MCPQVCSVDFTNQPTTKWREEKKKLKRKNPMEKRVYTKTFVSKDKLFVRKLGFFLCPVRSLLNDLLQHRWQHIHTTIITYKKAEEYPLILSFNLNLNMNLYIHEL